MAEHIINVSGGKDSAACYLLAMERGRPFRAVMADTGHESPVTVEWVERLHDRTGGPKVEVFRADFTPHLARRRQIVQTKWREEGVSESVIERALAALQPTGIPFVDLCLWKGRFPSRRAQFCTEFLKRNVMDEQVIYPALMAHRRVVQWIGVRRDESLNRAKTAMFRRYSAPGGRVLMYAPIIHWTAADCFALARRHNLDPNPLYLQGMGRVGCFPCINASKAEVREIMVRYPEVIDRLEEWEAAVEAASKRGAATFFASDVTPEGAALAARLKADAARIATIEAGPRYEEDSDDERVEWVAAYRRNMDAMSAVAPWPKARDVAAWARTDRGGRQFNWLQIDEMENGPSCSSQYGLCE